MKWVPNSFSLKTQFCDPEIREPPKDMMNNVNTNKGKPINDGEK